MPPKYINPTLAGIFDPTATFERQSACAIAAALAYPDDSDEVASTSLAAARAPRASTGIRGVTCLLVGRIYDMDGLRKHRTEDSEQNFEQVMANAYRQLGTRVLDMISGNFVLLVWDHEARRGFIAQDQIGARSLYYFQRGGRLYFASDIKPLLRILPTRPAPDEITLVHQIVNSDPPMERTVYEGVRRLCGAHLLELTQRGWERQRYWAPNYAPRAHLSQLETQEGFWRSVSKAVHARMRDAEPLGIIMSGGVDSTTVAAAAAEGSRLGLPLPHGYSAVFPGRPELDESDRVDMLVDALGMPSTQIEPQPGGVLPVMVEYLRTWDVPVPGPGYVLERPLLERAARDGITVLLDGQGGDEVFGLSPFLLADRIRSGRIISSMKLARRFPLLLEHPPLKWSYRLWKQFGLMGALPYPAQVALQRRRNRSAFNTLLPPAARLYRETDAALEWRRNRAGPLWWSFKATTLTQGREKTYLAEYLRHRAAMAGIEARPPLMDLDLVKFALSYPPELDFDNRYDRPNIRAALQGRVPDALRLDRRKSSLGPFYHEGWIGPDLPLVRELLLRPRAEVCRFVDRRVIEDLLADPPPVGGRRWLSFGSRVWGLLGVELFLKYQQDADLDQDLLASTKLVRPTSRIVRRPAAALC